MTKGYLESHPDFIHRHICNSVIFYLTHYIDENQLLKMTNCWKFIFRKDQIWRNENTYWSTWLATVFSHAALILHAVLILAIELMNWRELQWSCDNNIPVSIENIPNLLLIFFLGYIQKRLRWRNLSLALFLLLFWHSCCCCCCCRQHMWVDYLLDYQLHG